jgi:RNA polymerase sigma-70 factor (ECF subfamily)
MEEKPRPPAGPPVDLLLQIKNGSMVALKNLYEENGTRIHRYFLSLSNNHSVSDELVQETFIRLWEKRRLYKPGLSNAYSYILSIARNIYFQYLRRRKRELRLGEARTITANPPKSPSEISTDKEVSEAVRLAIKSLDPHLRDTLNLIYLGGFSYREAAEALGISQKGVEKRVRTAFDELHRILSHHIR